MTNPLADLTPELADALRLGRYSEGEEVSLWLLGAIRGDGTLTEEGERLTALLGKVPAVPFPIRRCTVCGELFNTRMMAWALGDAATLRAPCILCAYGGG